MVQVASIHPCMKGWLGHCGAKEHFKAPVTLWSPSCEVSSSLARVIWIGRPRVPTGGGRLCLGTRHSWVSACFLDSFLPIVNELESLISRQGESGCIGRSELLATKHQWPSSIGSLFKSRRYAGIRVNGRVAYLFRIYPHLPVC